MRKPTEDEIRAVFDPRSTQYFTSTMNECPGSLHLTVSQMYEYVPCGVKQILSLCRIFESEDVSTDGQYHMDGCETCDYGSSYTVEFIVKDVPLSPEMLAWIERVTK